MAISITECWKNGCFSGMSDWRLRGTLNQHCWMAVGITPQTQMVFMRVGMTVIPKHNSNIINRGNEYVWHQFLEEHNVL